MIYMHTSDHGVAACIKRSAETGDEVRAHVRAVNREQIIAALTRAAAESGGESVGDWEFTGTDDLGRPWHITTHIWE